MSPLLPRAVTAATLCAFLAACGESGPSPTGDGSSAIALVAEGVRFDQSELTAAAGTLELRLDNRDPTVHNLRVRGGEVDEATEVASGPVIQTLLLDLASGTYEFQCDVHPGQMKGTLTVR